MIGRAIVGGVSVALPLLKSEPKAVRRRRGVPIHAYVGANGAGKSLLAALDTIPTLQGIPWSCDNPDHFHTAEGITSGVRRVLSTMRFTTPDGRDHPLWTPLDDYAKVVRAEHCDMILDEVGGAAASAAGADDLPQAVKTSLQEMRRRDVSCRHTAPAWNRATKTLRECTSAVTLVMGYMPVRHTFPVMFGGEHLIETFDFKTGELQTELCPIAGEHGHDSGRLWGAKRLMFARTYDAHVFDEWTTAKRQKMRPMVRSLFWRPGSLAESIYDTHAYVEKLGQVTDAGICLDCGGRRRRENCECESPTTRRARTRRVRAASAAEPGVAAVPRPRHAAPGESLHELADNAP